MAPDAAAPDGDDVHDVVLFYAYTAIERPDAVASTLKSFFAEHAAHFKGRVLVAREGVNGTACGSRRSGALPMFQALLRELVPGCETMPYKTSLASEQVFHDARVETVRATVLGATVQARRGARADAHQSASILSVARCGASSTE